MKTSGDANFQIVLKALKEFGLLLETDATWPSVAGLVAGERVRGSWWSHARSHEIFAVLQQIADHKDLLITRLVSGKVTFVHRRLWPEVISLGRARDVWQVQKLSPAALMLLDQVDQQGSLQTNTLEWPAKFKATKPGEAARALEKRLLIYSEEFHTESGAHAKLIETWDHWINRTGLHLKAVAVEDAKRTVENRVTGLNERFGAAAELPWTR